MKHLHTVLEARTYSPLDKDKITEQVRCENIFDNIPGGEIWGLIKTCGGSSIFFP